MGNLGWGKRATLFDDLHLLPKPGHHALQPLDIVPTFLFLVDHGTILDVPGTVGIFEGVDRFRSVPLRRADASDH